MSRLAPSIPLPQKAGMVSLDPAPRAAGDPAPGGSFWRRLLRPVLEPAARRVRAYVTAEVMRALRQDVMTELMDARWRQEAALDRLEVLLPRVEALLHRPVPQAAPSGMDPHLAEAIERLLLTLALEDGGRQEHPALLAPAPSRPA